MSSEEHEALLRRWIEAWNAGGVDAIPDFVTPDYVRHDSNMPDVRGPAAEQDLLRMYLAAFPDLRITIEKMVSDDEFVATRMMAHGTHDGELMGIPPSGRRIAVQLMEHFRFADGRIAEQWVTNDMLGLLQQIGALPAPG